ncbi:MAG TPA: DUF1761 domain-containing protein [Candidatus Solibacter sp.]|jgi:hypothetical protein|nr:DUF1761 domain-containing protein [Candidatus Solibacter sp.]
MAMVHMNWPAIVVSAVVFFAIGGLWYAPFAFAGPWMKAIGKTREDLGDSGQSLGASAVMTLISTVFVALLISWSGAKTLSDGVLVGLVGFAAFLLPYLVNNVTFERRPAPILYINGGYYLVGFVIMGAILGVWR